MKRVVLLMIFAAVILFLNYFQEPNMISSDESGDLSPAVLILREKYALTKGNVMGSGVYFQENDIDGICGEAKWEAMVIKSLPDLTHGTLKYKGTNAEIGTSIARDSINELVFQPTESYTGICNFSFQLAPDKGEYKCRIVIGNETYENPSVLEGRSRSYRNVAVNGVIPLNESESLEVMSPCENGVLELDRTVGTYSYRPATDFVGKDCFEYCIKDPYGNVSKTGRITLYTDKAKSNLYFHDMEGSDLHVSAIRACSEGLIPYREDANGLPIFSPDEFVTEEVFLNAVQKLCQSINETPSKKGKISESEALDILSRSLKTAYGEELEAIVFTEPAVKEKELTKGRLVKMLEEAIEYISYCAPAELPS